MTYEETIELVTNEYFEGTKDTRFDPVNFVSWFKGKPDHPFYASFFCQDELEVMDDLYASQAEKMFEVIS